MSDGALLPGSHVLSISSTSVQKQERWGGWSLKAVGLALCPGSKCYATRLSGQPPTLPLCLPLCWRESRSASLDGLSPQLNERIV